MNKIYIFIFVIILLFCSSIQVFSQLADAPWPMFGHDLKHTNCSNYNGPENLEMIGKFYPHLNFQSLPVIAPNGTILIVSMNDIVYAYKPDGSPKWQFKLNYPSEFGQKITCSKDGMIFVNDQYFLYALNSDGSEKWRFFVRNPTLLFDSEDTMFLKSSFDSSVYVINPDGTLKKKYVFEGYLMMLGPDGSFYLLSTETITNDDNNYTYFISLKVMDNDGKEKWSHKYEGRYYKDLKLSKNGTIYFCFDKTLLAYDKDGNELWNKQYESSFMKETIEICNNETILFLIDNGTLHALNPDGEEIWKFDKSKILEPPVINENGFIFVTCEGDILCALNLDGTEMWEFGLGSPVEYKTILRFDNNLYIWTEDTIFLISENGSLIWSCKLDELIGNTFEFLDPPLYLQPIVDENGTIYLVFKNCFLCLTHDKTEKFRIETTPGEPFNAPSVIGPEGTIYVGSDDDFLYAVDSNLEEKWKFKTEDDISSSAAINQDGTIYVGSEDNYFYAINPDGKEKWKFETQGPIKQSPTIGNDGSIYIVSDDGFIYSITPEGYENWKYEVGESHTSPTIDDDGIIYVGSDGGNLIALYPDGKKSFISRLGKYVYTPSIGIDGIILVPTRVLIDEENDIYKGLLYALNSSGVILWSYDTGEGYIQSPAISSDYSIYTNSNRYLHKIDPYGILVWYFELGSNKFLYQPILSANGLIYVSGRIITVDHLSKYFSSPSEEILTLGPDNKLYGGSGHNYFAMFGKKSEKVYIYTNGENFSYGDILSLSVFVENPNREILDLYVAVQLGELLFWYPMWDLNPQKTSINDITFNQLIAQFEISPVIPNGEYTFYAAILKESSLFPSGIDSVTIKIE